MILMDNMVVKADHVTKQVSWAMEQLQMYGQLVAEQTFRHCIMKLLLAINGIGVWMVSW